MNVEAIGLEAVLKEREEKFAFGDTGKNPLEFLHKGQLFKIKINHVHSGNDIYNTLAHKHHPVIISKKPSRYVTFARVYKDDACVVILNARCHPNDNPSRKLGRKIALNRAVKWIEENF